MIKIVWWKILLLIIVIIAFLLLLDCIWCMTRFEKTHYVIESSKVTRDCRFVMLSDLHGKSYGKDNDVLIRAIEEEEPDAVWVAGDMITSVTDADYDIALSLCARLAEKYPVYYALGNHEQKWRDRTYKFGTRYKEYVEKLEDAGVILLDNTHVQIPELNMNIYGVTIDYKPYYKRFSTMVMDTSYLEGLLGEPEESCCNILLAHNPDFFPTYSDWGADLTLSGHVHGGIVRLPFLGGVVAPSIKFFPKYDSGLFEMDDAKMVLGRGLGTHTLPVRIFNSGDLVCVEVKKTERIQ